MGFADLAAPGAPWAILGGCVCGYIAYSMVRLKSWLRWVMRGGPPLMICALLSRSLGVQDPWVAILSVTVAVVYVAARSAHERDLFQDAGLVDDPEEAKEPGPNT